MGRTGEGHAVGDLPRARQRHPRGDPPLPRRPRRRRQPDRPGPGPPVVDRDDAHHGPRACRAAPHRAATGQPRPPEGLRADVRRARLRSAARPAPHPRRGRCRHADRGFSDFAVQPTCGLVSATGLIGFLDDPSAFYEPDRLNAQLLWFRSGYVEYRFPNRVPPGARVDSIQLTAEVCSEAPLHDLDWPSDIGGLGQRRRCWANGRVHRTSAASAGG